MKRDLILPDSSGGNREILYNNIRGFVLLPAGSDRTGSVPFQMSRVIIYRGGRDGPNSSGPRTASRACARHENSVHFLCRTHANDVFSESYHVNALGRGQMYRVLGCDGTNQQASGNAILN